MCYNLFGENMRKILCILTASAAVLFTCYYMHFGGIWGNKSALSTVGLDHPVLFTIWGVLTFIALAVNIIYAYSKTKFIKLSLLLIPSLIGMALTLMCDFDYSQHAQYLAHCIGSLTFSAVTGTTVFLLFLLDKRYIRAVVCAVILITDTILLIIFKETALIEVVPIFSGYILLLSYNLEKEKIEVGINR